MKKLQNQQQNLEILDTLKILRRNQKENQAFLSQNSQNSPQQIQIQKSSTNTQKGVVSNQQQQNIQETLKSNDNEMKKSKVGVKKSTNSLNKYGSNNNFQRDFNLRFFLNEETKEEKILRLLQESQRNSKKKFKLPQLDLKYMPGKQGEQELNSIYGGTQKNKYSSQQYNYFKGDGNLPLLDINYSQNNSIGNINLENLNQKLDLFQLGKKNNFSNRIKKNHHRYQEFLNDEPENSTILNQYDKYHLNEPFTKQNLTDLNSPKIQNENENISNNQNEDKETEQNPQISPRKKNSKKRNSASQLQSNLFEKQIHGIKINNKKQEQSVKHMIQSYKRLDMIHKEQQILGQMIKKQKELY